MVNTTKCPYRAFITRCRSARIHSHPWTNKQLPQTQISLEFRRKKISERAKYTRSAGASLHVSCERTCFEGISFTEITSGSLAVYGCPIDIPNLSSGKLIVFQPFFLYLFKNNTFDIVSDREDLFSTDNSREHLLKVFFCLP